MVFVKKPAKKKARIVICGNFLDQFSDSSTTNIDAPPLRALIANGWRKGNCIGSLDITAAFLHADLPKDRFLIVAPPPCLVALGVCKPGDLWIVRRALYGLKESPRYWEDHRDGTLTSLQVSHGGKTYRLFRSEVHHSIWHIYEGTTKHKRRDPLTLAESPVPLLPTDHSQAPVASIGVYVDDFIWTGPRDMFISFHKAIKGKFKVGDPDILGEGECRQLTFLGVTLEVDGKDLLLHQAAYAWSLLERFAEDLRSQRAVSVPSPTESYQADAPATKDPTVGSANPKKKKKCQQILGALLWLVTRTRPDIAYAHSRAASFVEGDVDECYTRAVYILRYLVTHPTLGLRYAYFSGTPSLTIHGDCSWAPTGVASHEGNVATLNDAVVAWRSKRQQLVAMSSCEGELIAACQSLIMGRSLRLLVAEMYGTKGVPPPFHMGVDNQAAIQQITQGEHATWRSRHISIRAAAIVSAKQTGELEVGYVKTDQMKADGLTKALTPAVLDRMRDLWHMVVC